jgi:Cu(I)/Ag(I) efflux system membrane fusion protein
VVRIEPPVDENALGAGTAVLAPNGEGRIDPGLAGTNQALQIELATGSAEPVLAVPVTALRSDGGQDYVVVRTEDGNQRTDIGVGATVGGWVEVRAGELREGDRVVVRAR